MSADKKSSYLILGGCGFIGRNLVQYLVDNNLAYHIRIADKVLSQLAYLNKQHEITFKNPIIEFVNANLLNKKTLEKVFQTDKPFDYVINCAGETRYGLTEPIYEEGIVNLTLSCAKLAALQHVKRYVEISCGRLSSSKEPHKEEDGTDPWTQLASYKLKAENSIRSIPNLNYTIFRPGIVYGIGDRTGIVPRLVIAVIYHHTGETMKFLWSRNVIMNTVHVFDLCRAICYSLTKDEAIGQIYNIVDSNCTTQGDINDTISEIFNVNIVYMDNIISKLCKLDFNAVVEEINDTHSSPWSQLCERYNITNTPLSSYLHKEDLYNKNLHLDGQKLRKLGFEFAHPKITKDLLLEVLEDYINRNLFPKFNND